MARRHRACRHESPCLLACVSTPFFDTSLRRVVEEQPNLRAYVARMMRRYYPEHAWDRPAEIAIPARS
jgi:hypothetical protein